MPIVEIIDKVIVANEKPPTPHIFCQWIWDSAPIPSAEMVTCLFRKAFTAAELGENPCLHISADGRYRAYLNGKRISRGPCRGTPEHYFYETVDLSGQLKEGVNVLAVEVRYYGAYAPVAEVHREPGLWAMIGPDASGKWIVTDDSWKVLRPGAIPPHPIPAGQVWAGYVVVDPCEEVDLRKIPADWTHTDFDDSAWLPAVKGRQAMKRHPSGPSEFYRELIPRQIPPLEETLLLPVSLMQSGRLTPARPPQEAREIQGELFPDEKVPAPFWGDRAQPLTLETPGTDYLIINLGELTTAYPVLKLEAPAGTLVEFRYSEALSRNRHKEVRDDPAAGTVEGYYDLFTCREGENVIEPFVWRTYRFLRISIHHPDGPVTLRSLENIFTGYPYTQQAKFESSDPLHKTLWDVSWRTARLCAHEHYEDCPYYEQLQYTGDTRLQALVAYLVAGDFRLARQALQQFAWSQRADGILLSRTPSNEWKPQIIPNFSLIWVQFLEDYYRFSGDASLVEELFRTMEGVLAWFDRFDRDGALVDVPYWIFTDWSLPANNWGDKPGPIRMAGSMGELNLRRIGALQTAARLAAALGRTVAQRDFERRVKKAVRGVRKHYWSKRDGLFRDDVDGAVFSEHPSLLAILYDLVSSEQAQEMIRRMEAREDLCRTTIYWSYYTFRVYEKLGLYGQAYRARLKNWTDQLALHASTWFEQPNPSRSDCHAWGSWIMCDLLTSVLGVTPAEPGFARVRIAPQVLDLQFARGTVPTVRGPIRVAWQRSGAEVTCEIELPADVTGVLVGPDGQEQALTDGAQVKSFSLPE
jgi:hypothetical protein